MDVVDLTIVPDTPMASDANSVCRNLWADEDLSPVRKLKFPRSRHPRKQLNPRRNKQKWLHRAIVVMGFPYKKSNRNMKVIYWGSDAMRPGDM